MEGNDDLREMEEQLYDLVAQEIRRGDIKDGLWLKAFSEAAGDKALAEAMYARLRVAQLSREAIKAAEMRRQAEARNRPPSKREIQEALKKADRIREMLKLGKR